jgi:transposase
MGSEIIEVVERRRRWPVEVRLRILEEVLRPGASVAAIAGRHGVARGLVYQWLRQVREGRMPGLSLNPEAAATFAPVSIAPEGSGSPRAKAMLATPVLAYVPARFEVIRHVRPACSCRKCESMVQAPMPELPIPRGMVDASFLAHIAVAKFCDHIPLYRQVEVYARSGLDLDRGQLAEWLGHGAWLLRPLVELIAAHVMAGGVIHAVMPEACFQHDTPDRKGEHCRKELATFAGWLHADGYAGFGKLYEIACARSADAPLLQGPPRVAEVACWAHYLECGFMCGKR